MNGGMQSSAQDEAERSRRLAAWHAERAERFERGHEGEERTDDLLDALPPGYRILRDCSVPGSKANIDHLVVGPTGIFLIDSKLYTGRVSLSKGRLWHNQYPMDKILATQEWLVQRVTGVIGSAPVLDGLRPVAVLCIHGAELASRRFSVGDVVVVDPSALVHFLVAAPPVLADTAVRGIGDYLAFVYKPRADRETQRVEAPSPWGSEPRTAAPPSSPPTPPFDPAVASPAPPLADRVPASTLGVPSQPRGQAGSHPAPDAAARPAPGSQRPSTTVKTPVPQVSLGQALNQLLNHPIRLTGSQWKAVAALVFLLLVGRFPEPATQAANEVGQAIAGLIGQQVQSATEGPSADAQLPQGIGMTARWICSGGARSPSLEVTLVDPNLGVLQWAAGPEGPWTSVVVMGRDGILTPPAGASRIFLRSGSAGTGDAGPWRMAMTSTPPISCG